jgi:leucyl/phenylalanyl-tRNA---protein transferase
VALAALVAHCRHVGIGLIDCQQETGHLASFGARPIAREQFLREVSRRSAEPSAAEWTYDLRSWQTLGFGPALGLDLGPDPGANANAARRI